MRSSADSFAAFAQATLDDDPQLYPAIVKQVTHTEALGALSEAGLFRHLVFQGDTAIRLCYGGLRYSEDLEFSAVSDLSEDIMNSFFECLRERTDEMNLQMDSLDSISAKDFRHVGGSRSWRGRIVIPPPLSNRPDIRSSHFVKVEVDDRKVHEQTVRPIEVRHTDLGQIGPLVTTKSPNELLADKVMAFLGRTSMKWRDVFDINFLLNRNARFDAAILKAKIKEQYADSNSLNHVIETRRKDLVDRRTLNGFRIELSPLLPVRERHLWTSDDVVQSYRSDAVSILDRIDYDRVNFWS